MPESTFGIRVSFREGDRARLLQAVAVDGAGSPVAELALTLHVDTNGTFDIEQELRRREIATGSNGAAYFSWWPWPRYGPSRNFVSIVRVTWSHESAAVYVEDLYE